MKTPWYSRGTPPTPQPLTNAPSQAVPASVRGCQEPVWGGAFVITTSYL